MDTDLCRFYFIVQMEYRQTGIKTSATSVQVACVFRAALVYLRSSCVARASRHEAHTIDFYRVSWELAVSEYQSNEKGGGLNQLPRAGCRFVVMSFVADLLLHLHDIVDTTL